MFKKVISTKIGLFITVLLCSIILASILFAPYIYDYVVKGWVFSGSGDGFRQMMPFQLYLYEHLTSLSSFYDASFGLGGDYFKSLSYYYSLSPLMWINFVIIWLIQLGGHINPSDISFWPTNQLIMAMVRSVITFITAFYLFKYLKFKPVAIVIATLLYGMSTLVLYYNFTWSFYGNLLYLLPLTLLGIERIFQERKVGLYIFAIALTLFSNFYFSYYEAIVIGFYFFYRLIVINKDDVINRWQKCYITIIATLLSVLVSIFGLYTGVSSFLNNDRQQNPKLNIPLFTPLEPKFLFFSDGFYITISILTIVALLAFRLYKYYYYRLFAIVSIILFIGSISQYFDSAFNGFSMPQRRWVYALAMSSSVLIALFIQHLSELNIRRYLIVAIPVALYCIIHFKVSDNHPKSLIIALLLIFCIAMFLIFKPKRYSNLIKWGLVLLIAIQQLFIIYENKKITIEPYRTSLDTISKPDYYSAKLNQLISNINNNSQSPLNRIDYMSSYALNSPFLYHYNGISLYSSIFDGKILDYYDNQLQINMPIDKNSTYRLLGDRANLMAMWNVEDRIRQTKDQNLPYGFKSIQNVKDQSVTWEHSRNTINYPSAHITNKIYNTKDLKSPLDKEQAMLQGVVLDDNTKANSQFSANPNLLSKASQSLNDANWTDKQHLTVNKNNGGLTLKLPSSYAERYKDMYIEMDVELLAPDVNHHLSVNEYTQYRNQLSYKYRRFVTPVTVRIKASDNIHIKLQRGKYRLNVKGIYGEDYNTLHQAAKDLTPVKVSKERDCYTITKNKNDEGYIILPMTYAEGMHAKANHQPLEVKQANGIMTAIKANKGTEKIELSYTPPHFYLLIVISIIGVILSIGFAWLIHRRYKN